MKRSTSRDPSPPAAAAADKTKLMKCAAADMLTKITRHSLVHFSQSAFATWFNTMENEYALTLTEAFAPVVVPAMRDARRALLTRCATITAAPTLEALAACWPKRDASHMHDQDIVEHTAAFHRFGQLAGGSKTHAQHMHATYSWLETLDSPVNNIFTYWHEPTREEKAADDQFGRVMNDLLHDVFDLVDVHHLGSVAAFARALRETDTPLVRAALPVAESFFKWTAAQLAAIGAAKTLAALAEVYRFCPYDSVAVRLAAAPTLRARARFVRKMFKFVQLAFRARLEELAGNLKPGSDAPAHGKRIDRGGRSANIEDAIGNQCAQQ